jgi:hypothetical protein
MQHDYFPFGEAAFRIGGGVTWKHLHRLANRGAIPFERFGHVRMIRAGDLEAVRQAREAAGYVRANAGKEEAGAAR